MTEKRFKLVKPNNKFKHMQIGIIEDDVRILTLAEVVDLLNGLYDIAKNLSDDSDIILNWTQKPMEFDKDELYIKDNNIEITLKGQNLFIQVFIPKIKECFKFNYIVTGRRLERGYNTLKGDVE